jgi:putative spermidine/putrescine transport system permease protein
LKEAPFIALMILALLARLGDEYEQAARVLGASAWQRFRHVTLPLIAPAVVSSSLMVFAFIFGAFEVPFIVIGLSCANGGGRLLSRAFFEEEPVDKT